MHGALCCFFHRTRPHPSTHRAAIANAVRCNRQRSALQSSTRRTAIVNAARCIIEAIAARRGRVFGMVAPARASVGGSKKAPRKGKSTELLCFCLFGAFLISVVGILASFVNSAEVLHVRQGPGTSCPLHSLNQHPGCCRGAFRSGVGEQAIRPSSPTSLT